MVLVVNYFCTNPSYTHEMKKNEFYEEFYGLGSKSHIMLEDDF